MRVRAPAPPSERIGAVLLREAVEGLVSPDVARQVISEALEAWRRSFPETLDELRVFVCGPLARRLRSMRLDDEADEIGARFARLSSREGRPPTPDEDDEPTARIHRLSLRPAAQPPRERVRVLVLATGTEFADALAASPGADGLAILCVATEAALAGALHASGPLVVVIDAATSGVHDASLGTALSQRSGQLSVLITDADQPCGRRIVRALSRVGIASIGVAEGRSIPSIAETLARESV